MTKGEWQSDK